MERSAFIMTRTGDDTEKATLPFVKAVTTTASDMEPVDILRSTDVYLARNGHLKVVEEPAFPPQSDLMDAFMSPVGRSSVCAPRIKERGMRQGDLIEGAVVVNAPTIIKEISEARNVLVHWK